MHLNTSYAELARRAKVSNAGLTRWRINDSGDTARLARLVSIATALVADDAVPEAAPHAGAVTYASVVEAIKGRPLQQLEDQLFYALEGALGNSIEACSVCNLEMIGKTVKLTLMLE